MTAQRRSARQVALFVEGETERGSARHKTLADFFHRWLDPRLPPRSKVGILPVNFRGVTNYLNDYVESAGRYLDDGKANFVVGLIDLYGIPSSFIDLSKYPTVEEKVTAARRRMRRLVPQRHRDRFHQHFAVHEVEAWLLAYPEKWPADVRNQITRRPPEQVNFDEPPAKFLKRILRRRGYKKTVAARNIFPTVDPQIAIEKCPYLRALAHDLLEIARRLL